MGSHSDTEYSTLRSFGSRHSVLLGPKTSHLRRRATTTYVDQIVAVGEGVPDIDIVRGVTVAERLALPARRGRQGLSTTGGLKFYRLIIVGTVYLLFDRIGFLHSRKGRYRWHNYVG